MRVLVTGATGYIGGRLVPRRQVTLLDDRKVSEATLLEYQDEIEVPESLFDLGHSRQESGSADT